MTLTVSSSFPATRRFPFRLGTTSYIYPTDILTNVCKLASEVDDIEIVLFESDELANYPSQEEIRQLKTIANQCDLSYTIHLPLDIQLGDLDTDIRSKSVGKCLRAITATAPLKPHGYIVHFQGLPEHNISQWLHNLSLSIGTIVDHGVSAELICVETLDYPFHLVEDLIHGLHLSVCLDVGHVILYKQPLQRYLERYRKSIRVVHLHGIRSGRDHRDLGEAPDDIMSTLFSSLLSLAQARDIVVTLEVFSKQDLQVSRAVVEKFCP
ncbi:MAG: sugar phosphate isomerase/epimerase [Deltaproteobacteria bacterium]|nr:sugar phosphate isomerase/epimerase [Deltaproteobacteria bacterium]